MKIAFVTTYDARDIKNWSGTPYYMVQAMERAGLELVFINNLQAKSKLNFGVKIRYYFYHRLLKGRIGKYIPYYSAQNLKYIAEQAQNDLLSQKVDLVFSPGAIPIAYLKTGYPVVMWSDATFAVMENYYPEFTGLAYSTIHDCHAYEHKVMTNSDMLIFSSEWAARSAVSRYHAKPSHVHVIQYGANINSVFTPNEEIENIINSRSRAEMKLLFIGQNWERKGAEKAIEVVNNLNKNGLISSLTIIGCKPPDNFALPQCVNVLGFVDKSKPEGMKLIEDCFRNSHFFILPTIAECTPIVFSEANSFALPVLSNHTGGIPSVIQDNINGLLFDPEADAETWVKGISKIWNNPSNYVKLCKDSYNEYFNRLNWDSAIAKLLPLLQEVVVQHSQN